MKFTSLHIVLFVPVLAWVLVRLLFDFNGLYGQDAHAYAQFAQHIFNGTIDAAYLEAFNWPPNYPLFGGTLAYIVRDPVTALQMISMLALMGTAYYCRRLLQMLYAANTATIDYFVLFFLVLSPYMLRAGLVVMSDMLSAFLVTGALFHLIRYRDSLSWRDFVSGAFLAGLAVTTRYGTVLIVVVPVVFALISAVRNAKFIPIVFGCFAALLAVLPFIMMKGADLSGIVNHEAVGAWSFSHFFMTSFATGDGVMQYSMPNLLFAFQFLYHPGFIVIGVLLVLFGGRRYFWRSRSRIITIALLIYVLFVAGMNAQNPRYLVVIFPIALVLLFPGWQKLLGYIKSKWKYPLVVPLIAGQIMLFGLSNRLHYQLFKLEQEAVVSLREHPAPVVYTFYLDGALRTYGVPHQIVNLWEKDIPSFQRNGMVLFNESQFARQWEGRRPMTNFNALRQKHRLSVIDSLAGGWKLYRID